MVPELSQQPSDAPALTGRATLGATIGNMLEFYDFVTYSFFAIQIGRTFFPSHSQFASLMLSLATFGAGFVTRPIGALVIGAYSDRVGRRPAMILSFTMMGSAIIALALTPSYDAIGIAAPILVIVARLVQGFSLGGEDLSDGSGRGGQTRARRFLAAGEPTNRRNRWCVGGLGAFAGNDQRGTRFLWLAG